MKDLNGKTLFITGGSRGIGLAIALKAAKDGANIAIAAKTAEPHPKLEGTIFTAAEQIEKAGGKALPLQVDIRDEKNLQKAIERCANEFGGIDICINNASAINLTPTEKIEMKRFDLMNDVNTRGTFMTSKHCLPYLKRSDNPHILMLSPPLEMKEKWFAPHTAYSIAKYGMSLCVLGMAGEFKKYGIGVNALWPRTAIATAAIANNFGPQALKMCRKPEILADSAYIILTSKASETTGNFYIDDSLLADNGVTNFTKYKVDPNSDLIADFFIPDEPGPEPLKKKPLS